MADLATNHVGLVGLQFDDDYVAAGLSGDTCETGPGILLLVRNDDTVSHQVTLVTPGQVDGDLAIADRAVSVPGSGAEFAIPVTHRYRDRAINRASITYDDVTSLSVAVIKAIVT